MPLPRTIRYTRIPSQGTRITNSTQKVLDPPPRSLLRKMSPKIQNKHMNQAKNRKNSNSASRNEPLSLNIDQPFGEASQSLGASLASVVRRAKARHRPNRVRPPRRREPVQQPPPGFRAYRRPSNAVFFAVNSSSVRRPLVPKPDQRLDGRADLPGRRRRAGGRR